MCDWFGLSAAGPLENIEGRFGQEAWPLPLFPENKGGCPDEVIAALELFYLALTVDVGL